MNELSTSEAISSTALRGASTTTGTTHDRHADSRFSCNICLDAVTEPVVTQCGHLYCWPCLYRWLEPGMLPGERQALTGNLGLMGAADATRRVCPVCKAPCSVPTIVPIYVRTDPATPTRVERFATPAQEATEPVNSALSVEEPEQEQPEDPAASTGLRQRLRFRSRDSEINASSSDDDVPARPSASSPVRNRALEVPQQTPPRQAAAPPPNQVWATPLSPPTHRASLTHGLALTLQQALRQPDAVPPLHRPMGVPPLAPQAQPADVDATEFLSRILLMLGSFVILCLLLF